MWEFLIVVLGVLYGWWTFSTGRQPYEIEYVGLSSVILAYSLYAYSKSPRMEEGMLVLLALAATVKVMLHVLRILPWNAPLW